MYLPLLIADYLSKRGYRSTVSGSHSLLVSIFADHPISLSDCAGLHSGLLAILRESGFRHSLEFVVC